MSGRLKLVIDIDRCWGCYACEVACKQEHDLPAGLNPIRVIQVGPRNFGGKIHMAFIPVLCQHCYQPECIERCLEKAIFRTADGAIMVDANKCLGCGVCVAHCPYGAIDVDKVSGTAVKCDLCVERRARGQVPSCVQHCIGNGIHVVDEERVDSLCQGRSFWETGAVLYLSTEWIELGKHFNTHKGRKA